jgi:hypothetical protein
MLLEAVTLAEDRPGLAWDGIIMNKKVKTKELKIGTLIESCR